MYQEVFSKTELTALDGGANGRFAFIVSASGMDPDDTFRSYRDDFVRLGAREENCVLVPLYAPHVRDERGYNAFTGDAEGLLELMEGVTGVWFTGGDQYFTAKCFIREDGTDTKLLTRLREIYASGGVIGGSSAGAAIMSRVMIGSGNDRGVLSRDIMYGYDKYDEQCEKDDPCDPLTITQGLGFFPHGVVDQHFNKRPRLIRLIEACLKNREGARIGYAVSEDTALVYHAGKFSVLGSANVFIVDCTNAEKTANGCYRGVKLSSVQKGDTFDIMNQQAAFAPDAQLCKEEDGFYRDYVTNLITNSPTFDAMMEKYYLCGLREDMYRDEKGSHITSGCINIQGTLRVRAEREYEDSTVARTTSGSSLFTATPARPRAWARSARGSTRWASTACSRTSAATETANRTMSPWAGMTE